MNISPCEISFKIYPWGVEHSGRYLSFLFAPSSSVWNNNAKASGDVIKVLRSYFDAETFYTNGLMIYEYGVPDIKERFAKALNHLATFCEKKKETF